VTELGADERAQRASSSRFSAPAIGVTVTGFLRSAINAVRTRNDGVGDPIAIPEFRTGSSPRWTAQG
jgi:hypothetical protein